MPSLKDLNLSNEKVGGDLDVADLPKMGGMRPLVTPGTYRFQLPKSLATCWDKVMASVGERITAIFDADSPLVITQSPGGAHNGEPFQTRISNVERPRGKNKILASDMDYVLKALGFKGRPKTNIEYINALSSFAGKEFNAQVEYQWYCNPKKHIWVASGEDGSTAEVEQDGCGARYYQKDVQKVDGKYPERITCGGNDGSCGASLRAMEQLSNIG